MVSLNVDPGTRDQAQALKEDFGFDSIDAFVSATLDFVEENADAFEAFAADEGDEGEDEE